MGGNSSKQQTKKDESHTTVPFSQVRRLSRPTGGEIDNESCTQTHAVRSAFKSQQKSSDAQISQQSSSSGDTNGSRTLPRARMAFDVLDASTSEGQMKSLFNRSEVRRSLQLKQSSYQRRGYRNIKEYKHTVIEHQKSNAIIVAAIDFGTTYSGFAYSFISDPLKVFANNLRGPGDKILKQMPTVVLMDPRKHFHSFGEDARKKYVELMKSNNHKRWYLFERFKMKLFVKEKPLEKDMVIEDILGKQMKAINVFAAAIKYIREQLLGVLNDPNRNEGLPIHSENDIRWVLTVPAIWNDLSKKFMREAANMAGIPDEMLILALEPEAASLSCKQELGTIKIPVGCKYLLLDLGGGTADITCYKVNIDGTLNELLPPTGGAFGGTTVDNEFMAILTRIFGADVIKQLKNNYMSEYWEFMDDFELKKRMFDGTCSVVMQIPLRMLELYKTEVGESVEESLMSSNIAGSVEFAHDKMKIAKALMIDIFNSAVTKIKEKTEELLNAVPLGVDSILLVGGFSESKYLQSVMQEHFGNLTIFPKEPSESVLKGAVIYGHEPKGISSRVCRYTYGIARMIRFIPGIHPEKKKVVSGKFIYCDDAFNKHIEIGTEVSVNTPENVKGHKYFPSAADQRHAVLEVYKSTRRDPTFVDEDGSEFVGLIKVDIDPKGDIWSPLLVKLIFGGTELKIEVTDEKNRTVTTGSVDFLG